MARQTGQRQRAAIMRPGIRRLAGGGFAAAAAALVAILPGVAPAGASAAATCLPGAGVQPVSPGTEGNELQGVAVLSACDAWAVGLQSDAPGDDPDKALIEHWDGTSWTAVSSPEPGNARNELASVRAVSPHDVWAVGFSDNGAGPRTFIVHWNGKTWTRVRSPSPSNSGLTSVRFVSAKDGWAVGSFNDGTDHPLTLHWNGKAWKRVRSPSFMLNSTLAAVSVVSARNVWAVGQASSRTQLKTLILHWNGTRWSRVTSPNGGLFSTLASAAAASATNVWAVGTLITSTNGQSQTLILHWNGRAWKRVPSPDPSGSAAINQLNAVTASSATSARAVGTFVDPVSELSTPLILRWNGARWTHVVTQAPVRGELLAVTGTSAARSWAVGAVQLPGEVEHALALHCC